MGDKVLLTVEERKILGKKVAKLRKEGLVPGVVYGGGIDSKPVMAKALSAEKAWREAGKRHPVELTVDGKKSLAMIKSADVDPVKRKLRHLSFQVVKRDEKVETEVPIKISGEGETSAEKAGLVVLQTIETARIEALPGDLPDSMEIDGMKFGEVGDHATVADIKPISGVVITSDPAQVVATVYEPSALQAANEEAGGDAKPGDEAAVESEEGTVETPAEGEEKPAEKPEENK